MLILALFLAVAGFAATPTPADLPLDLLPLEKPTLYIVGDGTANNAGQAKNGQPIAGWGNALADYLNPAKVTLANVAHAGKSSRTFYNDPANWRTVQVRLKRGDLLLLVFGLHDVVPPYSSTSPGSIPGINLESTKDLTTPDGKVEVAHTYGWYLSTMATEAQEKGARVFLLTVVPRNVWTNPKVEFRDATPLTPPPVDYDARNDRIERGNANGRFTRWTKELGQREHLPVLDVTNLCADLFEKTGRETVNGLYADHNQTNAVGANVVAGAIIAGLKAFPASPFVPLLSEKGQALPFAELAYVQVNPAPVK